VALNRTQQLGLATAGVTGTAIGLELAYLLRRDETPLDTVETAVAGLTAAPPRETALFNLLLSYLVAGGSARGVTWLIRHHGQLGPVRNRSLRGRHVHHYLPGIALAFVAGGASIVSRNEELDQYLAVPFGIGTALTLDEAALLLSLEDVYWSKEGILSVQVTLAAFAGLGALSLARRALRRGDRLSAVEELAGAPGVGPEGLVPAGPDADERDRDADPV
jgi:hypothetical protein